MKAQAVSSRAEYVFAAHIAHADAFAKAQGWRPHGRVQWQKRDGTVVLFLSLVAQLDIVAAGETVHVVGRAPEALRVLGRGLINAQPQTD
jgi:hypothetical protein